MDDIQERWTLRCMFLENWSKEFAVLWNPRTHQGPHRGLSLNGTQNPFSPGRNFTYYFRKIQIDILPEAIPLIQKALEILHPYTHQLLHSFFGAFEKLRKVTISFVMPVCPFVRMEQRDSTGRIFAKFDGRVFFENLSRNSYFIKIWQ